jgi:outer membrane protein insertion porin family
LTVKPGQAFDADRLGQTQRKIFNLGYFENVVIDTQPGSEVDKLVLVIDVSPERKTGTISLGAGFSSVEGLVGFLQVSQNNLFGNGQSVSAQWDFGSRKTSYSVSFTEPWLLDTPTSFGIDIFRSLQTQAFNSQGYDLVSTGGSLRLGRVLTPETNHWKVFNVYRYQSDEIQDVRSDLRTYISEGINNISSITPSLVRDTRDNIFDAGSGSQLIASIQLAGGFLGGDNNFYKPIFDAKMHFRTPAIFGQRWLRNFVLGVHGRIGFSEGFDAGRGFTQVPPSERFFMGGTDTVRGYYDRSLGASIFGGGRFMMLTNVEYGFKPAPPIKLRAFYDSGNPWRSPEDVDWSDPFLYPSWGAGMLFTIPGSVIQIRLDWGFPLMPKPETSDLVRGRAVPIPDGGRIHFNIGNIF